MVLDGADGVYGVEIAARQWHTIASLASGTVLYEVKPGHCVPIDDRNFAPWAPAEGSPAAAEYLSALLDKLGLSVSKAT